MKKIVCSVMILFCLSATNLIYAAEKGQQPSETGVLPATNFSSDYPAVNAKLPPVPVPPASLEDTKATAAYIAAVDAYVKAAQSYIDAATNDVNFIINERNRAIEDANKVVADYNTFFKMNTNK